MSVHLKKKLRGKSLTRLKQSNTIPEKNTSENRKVIESYRKLYTILDQMSDKLNCGTCGVCENDSIYLLPDEVQVFKALDVDPIEIDGVHFLPKAPADNQYCPFRDQKSHNCTIYDKRPAICRMFPLEIKKVDDVYWWGVCLYCPRVFNNKDGFSDYLIQHITAIELCLSKELLSFLGYADRICSRIDTIAGLPTKASLIRPVMSNEPTSIIEKRFLDTALVV